MYFRKIAASRLQVERRLVGVASCHRRARSATVSLGSWFPAQVPRAMLVASALSQARASAFAWYV
jgi:hypothetical protein